MTLIKEARSNLRALPWVRWQPGWDTLLATATLAYMIPSYYLMTQAYPFADLNFMFVNVVINVLLPAYYVLRIRSESPEQLGLTRRRWLLSLLISVVFASLWLPRMLMLLADIPQELVLSTVIFNGICLWEPFFVYCWLQLRFERAFGVLPGIILAGAGFASYHLGTYPMLMVVMFVFYGMMYGAVFRLTKNLLIIWPVAFMVGSTTGTVSGGFTFGWELVRTYGIILLVQGVGLWWLTKTRQKRNRV